MEYTWCVPSATNDYYNDISLYDHSKTTMSLALAIANSQTLESPLRLCSVGVSGIQSFIFQSKYSSFKNAAKIFRGRSFLVSTIMEAFKIDLCKNLDLISFVDCTNAGGNMLMLLPNVDGIENLLIEYQKKIEKFILEKYYGTLSVVIDFSLVVNPEELGKNAFLNLFKKIGQQKGLAKNQKFKYALQECEYILPSDLNKKVCEACGKRGHDDSEELCDVCEVQMQIGKNLPDARYLSFSQNKGDYEILPDFYISLKREIGQKIDSGYMLWSIDDSDDLYPIWRINNYTPDISEFSEIAKKAVVNGRGKPFLGYVKIDVDSLGKIITSGLPVEEYSISRFMTLSRSLHYFFNAYLRNLLKKNFPFAYTALSGGDDLFIILPWNQALNLVNRVRKDFQTFCCNNPEIHFSSAVVLSGRSEPFSIVNAKATDALDLKAKEFPGKDAIYYLGICFSQDELDDFIKDCNTLKSYINTDDNNKPITMSMLYRLYQYVSDALSDKSDISTKYSVYSKLRYDIARNIISKERVESGKEAIQFILDKFDNYKEEAELKKFKAIIINTIYECRKTDKEDMI